MILPKGSCFAFMLLFALTLLSAVIVNVIRHSRKAIKNENTWGSWEQQLRTTLDAVPLLVSYVDKSQRYLFVNKYYCEKFGHPIEHIIGRTVEELVGANAYQQLRDHLDKALAGQHIEFETVLDYPIEKSRYIHVKYTPDIREGGTVNGIVAVINDITDRTRAEQEREQLLVREREARSEAERGNRVKDEFLATLSHELRTPLNAVLGWSNLLRKPNLSTSDLKMGLATIERNALAQSSLIEDLLHMSRIISGKMRLQIQCIDLAAVLESALESARPAGDAKNITFTTMFEPGISLVDGDPTRLQQVVWNLLSNAVKFTKNGGRVELALKRVDTSFEVTVSDSGEGIRAEFIPFVFERFRQADASTTRKHGGMGLGLSIVKSLVELHGGAVRAKSPGEGKGATFTLTLPTATGQIEPDNASRTTPRPPFSPHVIRFDTSSLRGVKVLTVDDDADARELVRRVLNEYGIDVLSAASVEEAMRQFVRHRPNLIVSDLGMPGQDGYALIRWLRSLPTSHGADVPALALTAFAREEDQQLVLLSGFQDYMAKPFNPDALVVAVANLLKLDG